MSMNTIPDAPSNAEVGNSTHCNMPDTSAVIRIPLRSVRLPYYDLYLVEANYRDEEIQAKIAEKKVNGEYIYEKRVLRDHMSEQDAIDWVYGNMRPDSTYVWLHCHKEESK